MAIAGHDPTGGAGIVADVQTLTALGCHPTPVVTAVTAQDTHEVKQFTVMEVELVIAQARAVLEDMPVAAIKTGMLGNTEMVSAIAGILEDYPNIPLVVDPIMVSGSGQALSEAAIDEALRVLLLPQATVACPNLGEVQRLAPEADSPSACAHALLSTGCQHVYLTGTHAKTPRVINQLFTEAQRPRTFECERLPGNYHGSGCTLAAAIAAHLAHGLDAVTAVQQAQNYTLQCLKQAIQPGRGQAIPDRLFWSRDAQPKPSGHHH